MPHRPQLDSPRNPAIFERINSSYKFLLSPAPVFIRMVHFGQRLTPHNQFVAQRPSCSDNLLIFALFKAHCPFLQAKQD